MGAALPKFRGCEFMPLRLKDVMLKHGISQADRNRRIIERYDQLLLDGNSARGAVSILVREFAPISNRWIEQIVNAPVPVVPELVQASLF